MPQRHTALEKAAASPNGRNLIDGFLLRPVSHIASGEARLERRVFAEARGRLASKLPAEVARSDCCEPQTCEDWRRHTKAAEMTFLVYGLFLYMGCAMNARSATGQESLPKPDSNWSYSRRSFLIAM
jgi:hypothetical protein